MSCPLPSLSRPGSRAPRGMLPGLTLIEILMVMALVGLLLGGVVVGVSAISQTGLRSSSARVAAAVSFLSHQAVIKGRPMRLVFELGQGTWRAESLAEASGPTFLIATEKQGEGEDGAPKDEEEKSGKYESKFGPVTQNLAATLLLPNAGGRPKPAWEPLPGKALRLDPLPEGLVFSALYTPHQTEPFVQGPAYLYFWPSGQTEHALLHISYKDAAEDQTDRFFSITIDPVTGRAKVSQGRAELPGNLTDFDAPEESEAEEDTGL